MVAKFRLDCTVDRVSGFSSRKEFAIRILMGEDLVKLFLKSVFIRRYHLVWVLAILPFLWKRVYVVYFSYSSVAVLFVLLIVIIAIAACMKRVGYRFRRMWRSTDAAGFAGCQLWLYGPLHRNVKLVCRGAHILISEG